LLDARNFKDKSMPFKCVQALTDQEEMDFSRMSSINRIDGAGTVIWYVSGFLKKMSNDVFNYEWLLKNGSIDSQSAGRHQAYFLCLEGHNVVLRHYYRGGVIGKFNKDLFLREAVGKSRAMREFELLRWMRAQGLRVPYPLAARFVGLGLFYRADLIMERILNTRTLADSLFNAPLVPQIWSQIGVRIGQMHALGVDHVDLNCRNILLEEYKEVWLIDFDKCRRRADGHWKQSNLARLRRSLEKEKLRHPGLEFSEADWSVLKTGYQTGFNKAGDFLANDE
jgi:tRNA A-37 threonylcarbamoyl transferase component Bud32